jgi:hypothetical protein
MYDFIPVTLSGFRKGKMIPNLPKTGLSDNSIGALAYFTPSP